MRLIALAAALSLVAAAAWADGPLSTTSSADRAPPQPQTSAPPLPDHGDGAAPQRVAMGPCGPERVKSDGKLDTAPHGEIEAGIGTHGYRHLAGTVCQPIGQNGAVQVSASTSQGQWRRR
ncbi:MAG TPA: hypothetical protein VG248_00320 [Caulobacteraceae bacterium]|jgi:hypothetical protein|nr:hypothetical protein [Caulobacteraceae bacterium]